MGIPERIRGILKAQVLDFLDLADGSTPEDAARKDIDEAHRLWSWAAELWLFISQECGGPALPDIDLFTRRSVPRRGQTMPLRDTPLVRAPEEGGDSQLIGFSHHNAEMCVAVKGTLDFIDNSGFAAGSSIDQAGPGDVTKVVDMVSNITKLVIRNRCNMMSQDICHDHDSDDGCTKSSVSRRDGHELMRIMARVNKSTTGLVKTDVEEALTSDSGYSKNLIVNNSAQNGNNCCAR